jgi:hypothetical protein
VGSAKDKIDEKKLSNRRPVLEEEPEVLPASLDGVVDGTGLAWFAALWKSVPTLS